jgi:acetylglutamate kinase
MQELISKAGVLLEALPYLQRFRGAIFVIKYGGSFMDSPDPAARAGVARDVVMLEAAGIKPVLVHGGGKAITAALAGAGLEARFVQGMRVTDAATAQVVEKVLSREINPQIVNTINGLGGKAKGFSGTEIFTCRKLRLLGPDSRRLELGFVGEVTKVRTKPLLQCLENGFTPVISPTARDREGRIYNCNADAAAAAVAMALTAKRLVFMSDVPGLLRDPKDAGSLIAILPVGEVDALKKAGVIDQGMIPKVDSAVAAARAGVRKVSFVDGRMAHAALLEMFTDKTVGTEIVL